MAQDNKRLPVVQRIESRDATLAYDSKIVNGIAEQGQESLRAVKRAGLAVAFTGFVGIGQGIDDYQGTLYGVSGDHLNQYSTLASQLPVLVQPSASFGARDGAAQVGFLGELWVIGGNNGAGLLNDTWTSINGVTWLQNNSVPAAVSGRTGGKAIVLNNTLYIMGGQNAAGVYLNDIWSTTDGLTWTQVTAAAAWGPRADFEVILFGNTIYIAGGQGNTTGGNSLTPGLWHDVWSTTNGSAWTQQTASAPWIGRRRFGFYSVGSTLYVLGGFTAYPYTNAVADLWSSIDNGVTWTRVNSNAFLTAGSPMLPFTVLTTPGEGAVYATSVTVTNGAGGAGAAAQCYTTGDDDVYEIEWCDEYDIDAVTFTTPGAGYTTACTFVVNTQGVGIPAQGYGFLDGTAVSGGRGGEVVFSNGTYFYFTTYINGAQANEIWTSPDGVVWTLLTAAPGYATRSMQAFAYGNIWIIGGSFGGATFFNDVWDLSIGTTSFALNPTVAREFYNFNQTNSGIATPLLVFKSPHQGYFFNAALSVLTRITNVNYPAVTVFGLVFLDGVFYVMDPNGKIWGSGIEDPSTWTALNEIAIQNEPNGGVAIAKCGTYLVGFGQWSSEFFYDNANPTPGSVLSANQSLAYQIGCAVGQSVIEMEGTVLWVGQSRTEGAKVYMFQGYSPVVISTPFVDRVIQNDPLLSVYAFATQHFGHPCYVLTLVTSGITLVYDFTTQFWYQWTSLTAKPAVPLTSLSIGPLFTSTFAQVTASTAPNPHGLSDGDPVVISGVSESQYNGSYNPTVIDQFTISYVIGAPGDPQSGGNLQSFSVGPYKGVAGADLANNESGSIGGSVFVQDPSNGQVYVVTSTTGSDYGNPVDFNVVTTRWDGGIMRDKFVTRAAIVGDMTASNLLVRHSETDYQSWSAYRAVNMQSSWPYIDSLGKVHRIAFQLRHTAAVPQRVEAIEIDFEVGV